MSRRGRNRAKRFAWKAILTVVTLIGLLVTIGGPLYGHYYTYHGLPVGTAVVKCKTDPAQRATITMVRNKESGGAFRPTSVTFAQAAANGQQGVGTITLGKNTLVDEHPFVTGQAITIPQGPLIKKVLPIKLRMGPDSNHTCTGSGRFNPALFSY